METLQATFGIDEGAGRFGERGDGQQHVAEFEVGLEGAQRDHHLRIADDIGGGSTGGRVEHRLGVQQQHGLEAGAGGEHAAGIEAAVLREGAHELCAHGVARLSQVADGGAGLCADPVRQGQQAAGLCVVRGGIAEQDRLALATQQRGCDGLRGGVGCVLGCQRRGGAIGLADGRGHGGQRLDPLVGFDDRCLRHVDGPGTAVGHEAGGGDHRQRGALAHGLADALREQRMFLAQVGADDQRALHLRERCDRRAEPAHAFEGRELGVAQAVVDVVAAEFTREHGGELQLFERAVRADQRADALRTVVGLDLLEAVGNVLERRLPVDLLPLAALLQHGLRQAFRAVERFVRETVAVGDPAFVDVFVLERHHAHHAVVLDLDDQVGTGGIVRAHRLAARQFPGAGAVAERLARERADRADVDHVARQLGVDRVAEEGFDFGVLAAVRHAELHHAGHFLAETDAARAMDAAAHFFHADQRADVLVEHDALFFFVARRRTAVADGQVLQLAFAALVADGAIQRVVDQQELHDGLLGLDGLVALGANDHALRDGRGAGRHRLGRLFHVDQAHAAVGRDAEFLVIAEVRNVGARLFGRMHHHAAFGHFDLLAVEFDFDHVCVSSRTQALTGAVGT
ncbi:hypothetical protein D9M68_357180 [compost metagenome]